jgi:hypothetical protein
MLGMCLESDTTYIMDLFCRALKTFDKSHIDDDIVRSIIDIFQGKKQRFYLNKRNGSYKTLSNLDHIHPKHYMPIPIEVSSTITDKRSNIIQHFMDHYPENYIPPHDIPDSDITLGCGFLTIAVRNELMMRLDHVENNKQFVEGVLLLLHDDDPSVPVCQKLSAIGIECKMDDSDEHQLQEYVQQKQDIWVLEKSEVEDALLSDINFFTLSCPLVSNIQYYFQVSEYRTLAFEIMKELCDQKIGSEHVQILLQTFVTTHKK